MDLLWPIVLCTLENNFMFTAKHVRGLDNSIADSLSCVQMGRFKQLVPLASPLPCVIPASRTAFTNLLKIPGQHQQNKHIQQV